MALTARARRTAGSLCEDQAASSSGSGIEDGGSLAGKLSSMVRSRASSSGSVGCLGISASRRRLSSAFLADDFLLGAEPPCCLFIRPHFLLIFLLTELDEVARQLVTRVGRGRLTK